MNKTPITTTVEYTKETSQIECPRCHSPVDYLVGVEDENNTLIQSCESCAVFNNKEVKSYE